MLRLNISLFFCWARFSVYSVLMHQYLSLFTLCIVRTHYIPIVSIWIFFFDMDFEEGHIKFIKKIFCICYILLNCLPFAWLCCLLLLAVVVAMPLCSLGVKIEKIKKWKCEWWRKLRVSCNLFLLLLIDWW